MSEAERDISPPDEPAVPPAQPADLPSSEATGLPVEPGPAELPIDMPPNKTTPLGAADETANAEQPPAEPSSAGQDDTRTFAEESAGTEVEAVELIPAGGGAVAPPVSPPESPGAGAAKPSDDDRLMAALAWVTIVIFQLPLVSFVLLVAQGNRERAFQRHHAVTSILFWLATVVYEIVAAIVFTVLTIVTLGCGGLCLWVIFFLPHLLALYYALQAYSGKTVRIPFITDLAIREGWVQ